MKIMPLTTTEILTATGGFQVVPDGSGSEESPRIVAGVSIDSRQISKDELFIAIRGENHDGHEFISHAVKAGAAGVVVEENIAMTLLKRFDFDKTRMIFGMKDTTVALGDIARLLKRKAGVSAVAITGSAGKTTAKDMTASVMQQGFDVLATEKNFNNAIGLPLTLLQLTQKHEWAVLELGMNRAGEIDGLAGICEPDIGVILNIGTAHIGKLGSQRKIMKAKAEILGRIKPGGKAVLNADDSFCEELCKLSRAEVVLFGLSENVKIRASNIRKKNLKFGFDLVMPSGTVTVNLPVCGEFMIHNALAAAATGFCAGLSPEAVKKGLEEFESPKGRMNVLKTRKGVNIIDDTYNANPNSVKAALAELRSISGNMKKYAVLGDMLELGGFSEKLHAEIGEFVAESDIDGLFVTGGFQDAVKAGALDAGFSKDKIFAGEKDMLAETLNEMLEAGDWVLVKGSRGMKMEDIVDKIKSYQ